MHGQGPLPRPRPRASEAIEAAIAGFDAHLRDVCGLAKETRESRCRFVRAFLSTLFGSAPLEWDRIIPQVLIDYITVQAQRSSPGTAGALACALRSYLRFLQFAGVLADIPSDAIPRPAHWSLAGLPPSLSDAELTRFWQAFDRRHALGQRDYAMARCLTDMALRCHEVADIRLEDIDWRAAVLSLPHTKSQRADRLPLPEETAQALLDYLRQGRPVCTSRAVFVYHRAPLGTAVASSTVQDAMERAFVRAGLPWRGTHVLRHTAATRLLQAGCSLKAIADVLRHRSIDTTAIYTKVDLPHLTAVALPWPEEQP
jgi:integrase